MSAYRARPQRRLHAGPSDVAMLVGARPLAQPAQFDVCGQDLPEPIVVVGGEIIASGVGVQGPKFRAKGLRDLGRRRGRCDTKYGVWIGMGMHHCLPLSALGTRHSAGGERLAERRGWIGQNVTAATI